MAKHRIRITGSGIYGQPTDDNPTGEYAVGYEFDTDADLPASWAGRAVYVGDEPEAGSIFVASDDADSEVGKARAAVIRQAEAELDKRDTLHRQETAMLRDRAERAEADLQAAKEQIEALNEKLKSFEAGDGGDDRTDLIRMAVEGLDGANDAHWTDAGLPAVDAVSEAVGETVTRAEIKAAAPDAKRPA